MNKQITEEQWEKIKELGLRGRGISFVKIFDQLLNAYEQLHTKKDIRELFTVVGGDSN